MQLVAERSAHLEEVREWRRVLEGMSTVDVEEPAAIGAQILITPKALRPALER